MGPRFIIVCLIPLSTAGCSGNPPSSLEEGASHTLGPIDEHCACKGCTDKPVPPRGQGQRHRPEIRDGQGRTLCETHRLTPAKTPAAVRSGFIAAG
jgi:hypothetical protein